jgi:hypothetical protein
MARQLIGRSWLARRVKMRPQPASRIGFSKQQPARFVVCGLDDTAREENSAV